MRVLGVTIPDEKRLEISLTVVYGIGRSRAQDILSEAGVERGKRAKEVNEKEEAKIRTAVEKFVIEGDLKREVANNIRRLKDIQSYKGTRHSRGLPARGQRTKTNSRTRRGNVRKTMGSGKTKVDKK